MNRDDAISLSVSCAYQGIGLMEKILQELGSRPVFGAGDVAGEILAVTLEKESCQETGGWLNKH